MLAASVVQGARGQVLRIGGFDFNARARSELVYSTNVERQRSDVTSEESEDYYVLVGLDLTSVRPVGRSTVLDLKTGVSVEKHFVRDDLDNSSSPFGSFGLRSQTDFGKLTVDMHVSYDRLSESSGDQFSPDGLGKARDPRTEISYGAATRYQANRLAAAFSYVQKDEDHDEEQFANRNLEETSTEGTVVYKLHERVMPAYRYEWRDSVYPKDSSANRTEVAHRYIVPLILRFDDPRLDYAFMWQKEDRDDGVKPEWKPRHMLGIADTIELSPTLELAYFATYDNYSQPAEDQIQFQYGAKVRHQISRTANHSAGITRQPVETFGSTLESDETRYDYQFTKEDLFIYDLTLYLGWNWQHTLPSEGDDGAQDKTTYDLRLTHIRSVSRRLQRTFEYSYQLENSSVEEEDLVEHRVSLKYDYQF